MKHWRKKLAHILILGLGTSGRAAARLGLRLGCSIELRDSGESDRLRQAAAELRQSGVVVSLGRRAGAPLAARPDLVVLSPGITADSELGRLAKAVSSPVVGEFEFGAEFCEAPIMAVTGTNGKTTTVEMTVHCLRQAGIAVVAAGNIGVPLSEVALASPPPPLVIAEASSFQLASLQSLRLHAVAYLNLSPDHLDHHLDFADYARAKANIFTTINRADQAVVRQDLLQLSSVAERLDQLPGRPTVFTASPRTRDQADFMIDQNGDLCRRRSAGRRLVLLPGSRLALPGLHNRENGLAALALCEKWGLEAMQAARYLSSFKLSEHRMQPVCEERGIRVINDSKSTNPDALSRALQALFENRKKNIILIAGGLDKKIDFAQVKPWLKLAVRKVFCIGSCRYRLAEQWSELVDCEICGNFSRAVSAAVASAHSGDTVLLSPGCASQDMFTDYKERGRIFINLISKEMRP